MEFLKEIEIITKDFLHLYNPLTKKVQYTKLKKSQEYIKFMEGYKEFHTERSTTLYASYKNDNLILRSGDSRVTISVENKEDALKELEFIESNLDWWDIEEMYGKFI